MAAYGEVSASPARSALLAQVLVALEELATYSATHVGRGEHCAAVEQAAIHVGHETSAGEAAGAARGALPNASWAREELATYSATHVGRGQLDRATPHVIGAFVRAARAYPRSRRSLARAV